MGRNSKDSDLGFELTIIKDNTHSEMTVGIAFKVSFSTTIQIRRYQNLPDDNFD